MTRTDQRAFFDALTATLGMFNRDASPQVLQLWWMDLERFELQEVIRAFAVYRASGSGFPPKSGEIAKIIEGSPEDRAQRAWNRVLLAVQRVGRYPSTAFDDALIHAAVSALGGWVTICSLTVEETPFRAREFIKLYAGYAAQRHLPAYPPTLTGLIAMDPQALERDLEPVLIGDRERCVAVIAGGASDYGQLLLAVAHEPHHNALPHVAQPREQK